MSKVVWIDARYGAAGDMLLAALLDAGADVGAVSAAITRLADAASEPLALRTMGVRRHGLRALQVVVDAGDSTVHRGIDDVRALVDVAGLEPPAEAFALAVFDALARAEADVHGVEIDEVHFHEVGALDSLADVVGCAVALHDLGLLEPDAERRVGTVAVGGGFARTEHGTIPVPVPATLELLAGSGATIDAGPGDRELCTPTGAALLTTLATGWGDLPTVTVRATGTGAGTADPVDRPNVLRVVIGDSAAPVTHWRRDDVDVVESTIDDMDPRLWPDVLDELHESGAHDAWLTPVLMRKGRPGYVVTALCPPATTDHVVHAIVTATTTLGVRVHAVSRRALPREQFDVDVAGSRVSIKRGMFDDATSTLQPEYDDVRAAAREQGRPIKDVLEHSRRRAAEAASPSSVDSV